MDYSHVRGELPRFWRVRGTPDVRLGLAAGDFLVFDGTSPGTIKKLRPVTPGNVRNTPVAWGKSCAAASPDSGFDYAITGLLEAPGNLPFKINFLEASAIAGAKLTGSVDLESDFHPITWTAEEGP